jgi:hypothetical protein
MYTNSTLVKVIQNDYPVYSLFLIGGVPEVAGLNSSLFVMTGQTAYNIKWLLEGSLVEWLTDLLQILGAFRS